MLKGGVAFRIMKSGWTKKLYLCWLVTVYCGLFPAAVGAAPEIGLVTEVTVGDISRFDKYEIAFPVQGTYYAYPENTSPEPGRLNPFLPYDPSPPTGVEPETGITVDAWFLPPGKTNWETDAKKVPCFYYQPVVEVGIGRSWADFFPEGPADWRCRFSTGTVGVWQYRVRAEDKGGVSPLSVVGQFRVVDCPADNPCKGYLGVSINDPRFFEFSNGEPLTAPLINTEGGGEPYNTLARARTNLQKFGTNGIRFVRWFATGEGTNYRVAPFGHSIAYNWGFSGSVKTDLVDAARGKLFSFQPSTQTTQILPSKPGRYRLSFWSLVTGNQKIKPFVSKDWGGDPNLIVGSPEISAGGWTWHNYEVTISGTMNTYVGIRTTLGETPTDRARVHTIAWQRDEDDTEATRWGPNLLTKPDQDTFRYVDQPSAARLDEIFKLSEDYGVYHKLTLFNKNDAVLNLFQPDGSIGSFGQCSWGRCPINFYAAENLAARWYELAYVRYFAARWTYSTAIHSLELANECDFMEEGYASARAVADYLHQKAGRPVMMGHSFWGSYSLSFYSEDRWAYGDNHRYANQGENTKGCASFSNEWDDGAAYVREEWQCLKEYLAGMTKIKPIVRGEGGSAVAETFPQNPEIAMERMGLWYHKKVWAHVGILGFSADGEWYPLFEASNDSLYPNADYDTYKVYRAYEAFMEGEKTNNGYYQEIGEDIGGVVVSNINMNAWGVRDGEHGRVLLWANNKNQNWVNPGAAVVSGQVTVNGLRDGRYRLEYWNTRTGLKESESIGTAVGGNLTWLVNNLEGTTGDKAYKLVGEGVAPTGTPTPGNCVADVTGDGVVSQADIRAVLGNYGKSVSTYDIDGNSKVNGVDLAAVVRNWGSCP